MSNIEMVKLVMPSTAWDRMSCRQGFLMIEENAYIITLSEETRQRSVYVACS